MATILNTERDRDGVITLTDHNDEKAGPLYRIAWLPTKAIFELRCVDPNWLASKRRGRSKWSANLSNHMSLEGAEYAALSHRADRLAALRFGRTAA